MRLVLHALKDTSLDEEGDAAEATEQWDKNATDHTRKRKGRLARAPDNVTEEVATLMDVFEVVTEAYATLYQHQAMEVKSVAQHISNEVTHQLGAWMAPIRSTSQLLSNYAKLDPVFDIGGIAEAELSQLIFEFHVHIASEYCLREIPRCYDYPDQSLPVIDPNGDIAPVIDRMAADMEHIILAEDMADGDPDMALFVSSIHWLSHALPRLILSLALNASLGVEGSKEKLMEVCQAACYKFGDEKIPEDIHQNVRDASRSLRHNHINMERVSTLPNVAACLKAAKHRPHKSR